MIRRRYKRGEWLVRDDYTGQNEYASKMTRDYRGFLTTFENADVEHPQDFAQALDDPQPLPFYNLMQPNPDAELIFPPDIGETNVPTPTDNAAAHLFDLGIGEMVIGYSFVVR